jgi:hypothetical protein
MTTGQNLELFWAKVSRPQNPDACWEWTAALKEDGYGSCLYLGEQLAHRVSYKIWHGEIPEGLCVLHKCDNRRCVNPKHLFLGTRAENNKDRDSKGRTARGDKSASRLHPETRPRGEKHKMSKLSNKQVAEIRALYATGKYSHRSLGETYGVSHSNIGHILRIETRRN